ncbi:hypothetical protein [Dongshaea marina]|uniref:hypothetical protein n=1 Tax=Dongshaea marina TaxID=2047966 RepID=UPI000D3E588F|nr:hypothetical protein [Dongshaea marina]
MPKLVIHDEMDGLALVEVADFLEISRPARFHVIVLDREVQLASGVCQKRKGYVQSAPFSIDGVRQVSEAYTRDDAQQFFMAKVTELRQHVLSEQ